MTRSPVSLLLLGFLALLNGCAYEPPPGTQTGDTITYRAEIPQGEWPGWKFDPWPKAGPQGGHAYIREQFDIVTREGKTPRTFSGKITGLDDFTGVEVCLESLVGIPWTSEKNYQWEKVAPDGTFSITDANSLDADKAIGFRGPHTPWTFLRFNFAPNHAAKNIVLRAPPSKTVTITASGPDGKNLTDLMVEPFDAHSQVDDHGNWLNRQQGGYWFSNGKPSLNLVLPQSDLALFIHHKGYAGFYQIIEPGYSGHADHYHFVLMPGGQLKVRVLDAAGNPQPNVTGNWRNPAAPLSYWAITTDKTGEKLGQDLVPGTYEINVGDGAAQVTYHAEVKPNSLTEITLQPGKAPVVSINRAR